MFWFIDFILLHPKWDRRRWLWKTGKVSPCPECAVTETGRMEIICPKDEQ